MGFWGAAAWCNRAFFIAADEIECNSSAAEGVLELYALPAENCQNSLFDHRSFYADYDQRCFEHEVYYGDFCRSLEKSSDMPLKKEIEAVSGENARLLSNTVFNGGSAEIYGKCAAPFDRDKAGSSVFFGAVRSGFYRDNSVESGTVGYADVFSGGNVFNGAAELSEKYGSVLEKDLFKNDVSSVLDIYTEKIRGIESLGGVRTGYLEGVGVKLEGRADNFSKTAVDLSKKIGGANEIDPVNGFARALSLDRLTFGERAAGMICSMLGERGTGGAGRVEIDCSLVGNENLRRDLGCDFGEIYKTDGLSDRYFVNGGAFCREPNNFEAGVSNAVIERDPYFCKAMCRYELNGADGGADFGISVRFREIFADKTADVVSTVRGPTSVYCNTEETCSRLEVMKADRVAYSAEKGDAVSKFCYGSDNVYDGRTANFEMNVRRETVGVVPKFSEAADIIPKFLDTADGIYGSMCGSETASGKMPVRSDPDFLVCGRELQELRNVILQESARCFTSADIKIDISGGSAFNGEIDMDELAQRLSEAIGEAMVNTSEGVHYI